MISPLLCFALHFIDVANNIGVRSKNTSDLSWINSAFKSKVVKMKYALETCFIWRIFKDEKFTTTFSRQFQWLIVVTIYHFDLSLSKNLSSWKFQVQCNMNSFSRYTVGSSTAILLPPYRQHHMAKLSLNTCFNMIYRGWIPSLSSKYSVNNAFHF